MGGSFSECSGGKRPCHVGPLKLITQTFGGQTGRKSGGNILSRTGALLTLPNNAGVLPEDKYTIQKGRPMGEGAYGTVRKAVVKGGSGQVRALKTIQKASLGSKLDQFVQEVEINAGVDHPNIVKLYETFEDSKNVYLCLEVCHGGEMFDRILEEGKFSEKDTRHLMVQVLRAVYHCHTKQIAHRDLKPENFLLAEAKAPIGKNVLKVIDFGIAKRFSVKQGKTVPLTTRAGTAYYLAPEVLQGKYTEKCDIWSAGVILYILLCGSPPFAGDADADIYRRAKRGKIDFSLPEFRSVSQQVKDLILQMCKLSGPSGAATERLSAQQALESDWMKKDLESSVQVQDEASSRDFIKRLRYFSGASKFKKAALSIIAYRIKDEKIKKLRETFIQIDRNGDGQLSLKEIQEGIHKVGLSDEQTIELFKSVDTDNSGNVSYTEFMSAMVDKSHYLEEENCKEAFRIFDRNGDGSISLDELKEMLEANEVSIKDGSTGTSVEEVVRIFKEADKDGNGEITFPEFMQMMKQGT